MNKLIELEPNISAWGILPNSLITLVYRDRTGKITAELHYRSDEVHIEIAAQGQLCSFDAGEYLFQLVSKAQRIRLAHL